MKNAKYIMPYLENIFLVILAGFLCWYFKNGWYVLVLMFSNSFRTIKKDENEKEVLNTEFELPQESWEGDKNGK